MRRAAAAVVVALVATAPACRGGGSRQGPSSGPIPFVAVDRDSASPTDRAIAAAQARLSAEPEDEQARLDLAQAFLQKAREVGDPSLYAKARGLLDPLLPRRPADPAVLVAGGTLALAQHRFADALELGRRAVVVAPNHAAAYGVVADAGNELGRYGEALEATQRMADLKPNLAALSRVSYARELRGDLPGAIQAMTQAVTAGNAAGGENLAYVQVLLGHLLLTSGDLRGAEASYAAADRSFPGFAAARAGRARLEVARGRPQDAAGLLAEVVRVQPIPEYAVAHADALFAAGRTTEAAEAHELVRAIAALHEANGVNVDLDLALFDADHSPGRGAVARARRALSGRPGIFGHDVLAWSLFRTGQLEEAWRESVRALKLGTIDPQLRFHAAAIAFGRGDRRAAAEQLRVVLETNPRFSALYAGEVEELASGLGLSVPPPVEGSSRT